MIGRKGKGRSYILLGSNGYGIILNNTSAITITKRPCL